MSYRISIDMGGTFTDAIVITTDGSRVIGNDPKRRVLPSHGGS